MEGLIFIIILYFVFKAVVKKRKETVEQQDRTGGSAGTAAQPARTRQPKARKETPKPAPAPTFAPHEPRQPYQPIRPSLETSEFENYTGSLGGLSAEGSASAEGRLSAEGLASAEGTTTTQGGEVFTPEELIGDRQAAAAYAITQNGTGVNVLPESWTRNALLQAVVMHEILEPPRGRRGYHG